MTTPSTQYNIIEAPVPSSIPGRTDRCQNINVRNLCSYWWYSGNPVLESRQRLGTRCADQKTTLKWSDDLVSICGQMGVKPGVSWYAVALNGLYKVWIIIDYYCKFVAYSSQESHTGQLYFCN